jgi:hypothetical protein
MAVLAPIPVAAHHQRLKLIGIDLSGVPGG